MNSDLTQTLYPQTNQTISVKSNSSKKRKEEKSPGLKITKESNPQVPLNQTMDNTFKSGELTPDPINKTMMHHPSKPHIEIQYLTTHQLNYRHSQSKPLSPLACIHPSEFLQSMPKPDIMKKSSSNQYVRFST